MIYASHAVALTMELPSQDHGTVFKLILKVVSIIPETGNSGQWSLF